MVCVTIVDTFGGEGIYCYTDNVVVYDPRSPFVLGQGSVMSPPGALVTNPGATGTATFNMLSRYAKGATVPSGITTFNFKTAEFVFTSNVYEWMVFSGKTQVQYKGTGNIGNDKVTPYE